ncbi:TPA: hypothetical protein DIU27_02275 [Candidatus Collierbacteria bacterium]|uniref:Uncharacterized protein n=1 Tax=Candidatus Collierbacteria bacterium GW2011_GWB2_44_22 TaxID=1618387 RepID=A0A0G1HXW1_9BACT|nr:MAG: hypothetical protein UW31_C0009G0047 [Candidatus Collierbacteria bacterium GW2011_GWA2_44_13]KKT51200.1 MAG: hypothetical protein UW42_C0005G0008 [Candidatus Collierbacteria bacterium GW2011_GWB1_44_197]KKT51981.1 MAG: hypothetical protein UW44_C0005G0023 [Candidatus Collierbacteria bacterium GW2011_GWB2_44_22]KKT62277.1 MAG: hypothetical protein UW56_C0009G0051 [Candidatus Collierbacteria bacterium GW2011_GWD1_44_27]KKT66623.1 MAG: hypothetical protein UW58_C0005G0019 [Candidatus Colli
MKKYFFRLPQFEDTRGRLPRNDNSGQASLVLVLVLGLVSMMSVLASSSLSVSNVQIENTISESNRAWYAAWSGIDEIMYRLRSHQDFENNYTVGLTLSNGATASATVTGDSNQKIVRSSGFDNGIIKNLEVTIASSSSKASFIFAAQAGEGGFELEGNTIVTGNNGAPGNVYSNGPVLGIKANSGVSGSKILGSVWAVGTIGGLSSPNSGGVYIQKNAWANTLTACLIDGTVRASVPPTNCPYSGGLEISDPPSPATLASVDASYWKNKALEGGVWNGDCNIASTDGTDCSGGTRVIGTIQILGDLNVPSGVNLTITGPLWVKGDIFISQNNVLTTSEVVGKNSIMVVVSDPDNPNLKGRMVTSSNVQFNRNSQGAGIIFISENKSMDCATLPAIDMTSNTATVVFVAIDGCINVGSNSQINGILGKKIHVKNNSTIRYDPSLARAIVVPDSGGWNVVNIREY